MAGKKSILTLATKADRLEQRIRGNQAAQAVDLAEWIFGRIKIDPGARVLDLCAGTGAQTRRIAEAAGPAGRVTALDASPEALGKLRAGLGENLVSRVTCLVADMGNLAAALDGAGLASARFDLVFCAYGLYYAADAEAVLETVRRRLAPGGRIVIVGPFGPNNGALFGLLEDCGVTIAPYVKESSGPFLAARVLPWGAVNFQSLAVHTLVNPVRWTTSEAVMAYWKNTTFFDAARAPRVKARLRRHFLKSPDFVNEKWIMLAEMSRGR